MIDKVYSNQLRNILRSNNSEVPSGRDNMPNTKSVFGLSGTYKISDTSFPILTGKEVSFKNIVNELFWFMKGDTNVQYLNDRGTYIWNEDSYNYYVKVMNKFGNRNTRNTILSFDEYNNLLKVGPLENDKRISILDKQLTDIRYQHVQYKLGDCGRQYGWLWRNNDGIDQLLNLIIDLKLNPFSRRHVLSAWNIRTLNAMALPACHLLAIFKVDQDKSGRKYLNCHLTQRSGDMFLGVPYNISSYCLLTIMLADVLGYEYGDFHHSIVDAHIYVDHVDAVEEYLESGTNMYPLLNRSDNYLKEQIILKSSLDWFSQLDKVEANNTENLKNLHNTINNWIDNLKPEDLTLDGYLPSKKISANLHTGRR